MEQQNPASSSYTLPEKVKCRLQLPDGETREVDCQIGEDNLAIGPEPAITIPLDLIRTHRPEGGYQSKRYTLIYDNAAGKKETLHLEIENPQYFDVQLSRAEDEVFMRLPLEKRYAGFGIRFGAIFIDGIIIIAVNLLLTFVIFSTITVEMYEFVDFLLGPVYAIAFWSIAGWTPGKKLCGLKVIQTNGKPIGFPRSVLRYIGYLISSLILYIGFLMIIWDKKKQGLHDLMAGTMVVRVK